MHDICKLYVLYIASGLILILTYIDLQLRTLDIVVFIVDG